MKNSNRTSYKRLFVYGLVCLSHFSCKGASSTKSPNASKPKPAQSSLPAQGLAAMEVVDDYGTKSKDSLADIVKKSGKDLGLFQFVGVTCIECRDQWKRVNNDLTQLGIKSKVQHIVVFPNQPNEYTKSRYDTCVSTYFPSSKYVVDEGMDLLFATRDDTSKFFGMYILVKSDGTYITMLNHDDDTRVALKAKEILTQ